MVRLTLFLFILASLVILVLSNLSPIALTILGVRTLALPLGVWVVGAIGAGALTTLFLSLLWNASRPAARRPPRSNPRVGAGNSPPWAAKRRDAQPAETSSTASTSRRANDDWEADRGKADWDDWGDYQEPSATQTFEPPPRESFRTQTEIRDREDEEWANWEGYADEREEFDDRRSSARRSAAFDENLDDSDEFNDRSARSSASRRTDFETVQSPETRFQSGSVYSYGYRPSSNRPDETPQPAADRVEQPSLEDDLDDLDDDSDDRSAPPKPTAKTGEVYDAEYRVIVPPYRPAPEETETFSLADSSPPDEEEEVENFEDRDFEDRDFEDRGVDSIRERYGLPDDDDDDEDETEIWDEDWGIDEPPKPDNRTS